MARRSSDRNSRTIQRVLAVVVAVAGFVVAAAFVRLALDWSDSLPYEGEVTEARYIVFMIIAVALALVGVAIGVVMWMRAGRH
ncbi:MAG TPA: hypothetical protein PLA13_04215 [Microbacteriaceae bacterium]|jgi:ABC-type Fe3+ transport system permease subunit|nr:hypothetical protein [Microbacteriaceae bacterium]HQX35542.1 hypothetical protein [Microbacteriaceae bacterium]HQZ47198.1 hypothetical protein [Microbacteriaceae bacterium]HRA08249.1 hypothetical protein [Microbacteriaceae bacterium]